MLVLMRAVVYATAFVGFLLYFIPSRLALSAGLARVDTIGFQQVFGISVSIAGAVLAVWCILVFVFAGRGTPAPFDPPRRLVVRGPYRIVRNPMYIGGGLIVAGAAIFYGSAILFAYVASFWFVTHLFVVFYEEPTLRQTFGNDYEQYCYRVRRWWPIFRGRE